MIKKLISAVVVFTLILNSFIFAASYSQTGSVKTPVAISYEDLLRLPEVAAAERNSEVRIVNATSYNNSRTVWAVRLEYKSGEDKYSEDYILTVYPYGYDPITKEVNTLPFHTKDEGTAMFGPAWYYFGLFDEVTHNSCGFAIAERIKRWPEWRDQTFTGITYRGVGYTGSYPQSNDVFVANHTN